MKKKSNKWKKGDSLGYRADIDTNILIHKYINELKSTIEIAKEHNCTYTLVSKRLKNAGVIMRNKKESQKLVGYKLRGRIDPNSKKGNRKIYLKIAKKNKEWVCEMCGATKTNNNFDLVVHHKDMNNRNNDLNNLMVLCQSCHSKVHINLSKIWVKSNANKKHTKKE
ncbi:MAG: HNH endonuclease [Candidatus Woesearchaeota archaeon]